MRTSVGLCLPAVLLLTANGSVHQLAASQQGSERAIRADDHRGNQAEEMGPTLLPQKKPALKDELEKGLKARLPAEFKFVETVVGMVDAGTLPLDLVESTFLWARRKQPYPFPYFVRGLRLRAAKIGIDIP